MPIPGQKINVKSISNKWFTSLLLFEDQNPHPGNICYSQIPVGCLTPPPYPLGLETDRCITSHRSRCHVGLPLSLEPDV